MTRPRIVTAILWVAILGVVALAPASASAEELIADGDFESRSITEGSLETSHGRWTSYTLGGDGTATLVDSPVLSGTQAVRIDTRTSSGGSYIYQDIQNATGCFTWTFHIFPGQGRHIPELLYSWRGDNGPLKFITRLDLEDTGINFTVWDASEKLSTVLSPGEWHEVTVEADADQKTQKLQIDGEQVAELTATNADAVPDTIIIGDVAGQAFQALHTYDDVSLDTRECAGAPASQTASATEAGADDTATAEASQPGTVSDDGGGFPWWIIVVIVIVAAIVFIIFWRRRRSQSSHS